MIAAFRRPGITTKSVVAPRGTQADVAVTAIAVDAAISRGAERPIAVTEARVRAW